MMLRVRCIYWMCGLLVCVLIASVLPVYAADYVENFKWSINRTEDAWQSGYNNATISGDGQGYAVIRLEQNADKEYGDVMSPVISSLILDHDNIFEIKIESMSPDTTLDVQIQDVYNDKNNFLVFDNLVSERIEYARIEHQPGWDYSVIKLWIDGIPGQSEVKIDYIRIYSRPDNHSDEDLFCDAYADPDPFTPTTGMFTRIGKISDFLIKDYSIKIMNLRGRHVRSLNNTNTWDGRNEQGGFCEGGVYIYQIETEGERASGKVVLVK
ncbi:hypothetical protein K8S19_09265 [bacterium]|nr:hypothetical protein [bacterium]